VHRKGRVGRVARKRLRVCRSRTSPDEPAARQTLWP
jgi:hypothetical protein